MQLLNTALNKYNLEVEELPADLRHLIEGYQSLNIKAEKEEEKAKAAAFEKVVVFQILQYVDANSHIPTPVPTHEEAPPQYEGGESLTFHLNNGEPYPKFKGKFYWVAQIIGASQKYQLERQFISERIDENNQWLTSAILHEGNFYEIKDGYDNYFATLENGEIKKLTIFEIVTRFNAPKREPRESKPTPSVQEPKESAKDTASDIPFAQYLAIIEQYRDFKALRDDKKYNSENHKFESFIDSESNIYIKVSYTDRNEIEVVNWKRIGKGGKDDHYNPDYQGKKNYFEFVKGKLYGTPLKKDDEGWFRPCDKDGNNTSFVNGKVVESNTKRISELGYEIKEINSYKGRAVIFKDKTPPTAIKIREPELKPIQLPTRMRVPDAKREPHYKKLDNDTKLNSLIIKQEIMLGKMEIAQYKSFDGMQDLYVYNKENELAWHTPQLVPDIHYSERLYVSDNRIDWGNHYLRYNGKQGNAYVYLDGEQQPQQPSAKPAAAKPANDTATAQKFYKTAESLLKKSKQWYDDHRHSQTNTPKRQREYNGGAIEADIMAEKAVMYQAIGKAIENGTLPDILKDISPAMAKNDLDYFVYGIDTSGGYYSIARSGKRCFQQYGTPPVKKVEQWAAIEQLFKGNPSTPSVSDEERQKQKRLKEIENGMKFSKQENFFPTPMTIIEKMLKLAVMKDGMTVLEPSAGLGHIADAVRERYPSSPIDVCESLYTLQEALKLKGYDVVGSDTMKLTGKYDRILINPPFTPPGIDGDHVRYCFEHLLKPNGTLVAVMSAGSFGRTRKKDIEFKDWFDENDGDKIDLPQGSFMGKDAFVQTGVNTVLVKLSKGVQSQDYEPKPTPPTPMPPPSLPTSSVLTTKQKGESVVSDLKLSLKYVKDETAKRKYQSLIDDLELSLRYAK